MTTTTSPTAGTPAAPAVAADDWSRWSTSMRLVVTDPAALPAARAVVDAELDAVERACSRFRPDSEVMTLVPGEATPVSATLLDLVEAAVAAAVVTDGAVDPTLGRALVRLGYDRDIEQVRATTLPGPGGATVRLVSAPAPGWRRLAVDRAAGTLTVPAGVLLDLGATAKAWAADRCAQVVAGRFGCGVLVALGGDIATAGPAPDGGWTIEVRDEADDPGAFVTIPSGAGIATSSTRKRRWVRDGRELNHVLDPATSLPVDPVWGAVSVVGHTCVEANAWSTAALVRGRAAPALLTDAGLPARFVGPDGVPVRYVAGWPREAERG